MPFDPDLTTQFTIYIKDLKNEVANRSKLDVNTLIVKDEPTVIAGTVERADRNTQLLEYLD
jgi:hypothetical protein